MSCLFRSSAGFGGVVLFLPLLQVRQAISGFEAQPLQPPKKLGFGEGANWKIICQDCMEMHHLFALGTVASQ